jgi:steroid delta-isomerase-like uncharacterized protein
MAELSPTYTAILHQHLAAVTVFDMEGTLATLTEDCVFEDVPTGEVHYGREGVRAYYHEWWTAFGIVPQDIRSYIAAENFLVVETRFVGTHRGIYRGLAATGKPINLPVAIFISLRDGLMSGERFYYDRATLLAHIGVRGAPAHFRGS